MVRWCQDFGIQRLDGKLDVVGKKVELLVRILIIKRDWLRKRSRGIVLAY